MLKEVPGTGTQAGDATESAAIYESFGIDRPLNNPLYIGSVKTNIGHGESAAGLAGLLKSILILQRGLIPPHLNFIKANDKIPLEKWNIKVSLYCCQVFQPDHCFRSPKDYLLGHLVMLDEYP